jgi:hypothetical protein
MQNAVARIVAFVRTRALTAVLAMVMPGFAEAGDGDSGSGRMESIRLEDAVEKLRRKAQGSSESGAPAPSNRTRRSAGGHYRGRDGVPFPQAQLVVLRKARRGVSDAELAEAARRAVDQEKSGKPRSFAVPRKCQADGVTSKRETRGGDPDRIYYDRLWLTAEMAERIQHSEIAGNPEIEILVEDNPTALRIAHEEGVECLPYRIRSTGAEETRARGARAFLAGVGK